MPDIIVTTPKYEMANAAKEAEDCKRAGNGYYFRHFSWQNRPRITAGERVFYVEDGYIRGYAIVAFAKQSNGEICQTTSRAWQGGCYVYMHAESWTWIKPIPMRGFTGFRYFKGHEIQIVGGWLDPKPTIN